MNCLLESALAYAARGWSVFPCKLDKSPLTKHGYCDATCDASQISDWWSCWPDASIGYAVQKNMVVLDVDIKHELGKYGDESLTAWKNVNGKLPDTVMSLTGGGGVHYFFVTDKPVSCRTGLLPGVDVKACGGYVILPPSPHPSGRTYAWECGPDETQIAMLPEALYQLIAATKAQTASDVPEQITAGKRNDILFRLACSLRAKGLTESEILAALLRVNESRCAPPLDDSEVNTIVHSAAGYERGDIPGAKTSVKPTDFSDTGNAEIFEREYRHRAIWTRGGGWFVWDGKRWEQSDQRAMSLARDLSGQMLNEALGAFCEAQRREAADDAGEKDRKVLNSAKLYLGHANATRRKPRLDAMLGLAQSGLCRELSAFDLNPINLNTPGGIFDLTTGYMQPHSPDAMCSRITAAIPGHEGWEVWADLLKVVTCDDPQMVSFLQRVAGMSLVGKVYHEGIIIAHGNGRNGKSTFFNALADALGSYAGHIAVNTLTAEKTNKGATLATLRGKRLVLTGELEEHQRLSVAMLKALASTDTLVAEEKFRAPEEFKQSHTICLFTNHLPRVGSTDGGTWRRLTVVPFDAVIDEKNAVQNYGGILAERAGGAILEWAIEGAVEFIKNGYQLNFPERVVAATECYKGREDWLSNFITECCTKGNRAPAGELYAAYRAWSARSGEYIRRNSDFFAELNSTGFKKITSNGRNYWLGIELDTQKILAAQGFY